jgi:hypothetical protein
LVLFCYGEYQWFRYQKSGTSGSSVVVTGKVKCNTSNSKIENPSIFGSILGKQRCFKTTRGADQHTVPLQIPDLKPIISQAWFLDITARLNRHYGLSV